MDSALAAVAAGQHGLITRAAALAAGATPRTIDARLRSGRWVRVGSGVYRVAGAPVTWHQRALAACLVAGPGAAVSYRSAAVLHGISGFRPGRLEITVPPGRSGRNPLARVHRSPLGSADRTIRDRVPVTHPVRTLVDLSRVVDATALEEAVDDVLCRNLVRLERIPAANPALRTVLAAWCGDGQAQTLAEMRVVRAVLAAGLPQPVRQHWIPAARARVDLAYPEARIAVELDSFRWHGGARPFHSDRVRGNRIVAAGWRLLRATPGHEAAVAQTAATLLAARVA